jgi:RimJ/RimL family protein N-acetyltransferase
VTEGDGIRLRRATTDDVPFLLEVLTDDDVQPFLGRGGRFDEAAMLADLERQEQEPDAFGRFVIEVADEGDWRLAGTLGFERVNRRSRIAQLERLAVHPAFRGRRLADDAARLFQRHLIFDLDFHRVQLEIYGFNERAQSHAERAGFVREGVRRLAYRRDDGWVDGVLYGLVREDLERELSGGP